MNIYDVLPEFKRYSLYERGMSKSSYQGICSILKRLALYAHTEELNHFTTGIIRAFLYEGQENHGWVAKTFLVYRQCLMTFFSWCMANGYISTNPIQAIHKPKVPKALPRFLTKQEVERLLAQLTLFPWRYDFERVRNEAIIYTLLYSGIRLSELLNLKLTDINLSDEEIFVRRGKGKKDRIVPIHSLLSVRLRIYLEARKGMNNSSPWFFTGVRSEKPLQAKDVLRICKRLSRACGVKFTPHRLRHTLGRLSIEANLNPYKLKEILGHSNIATTMIYSSVSTKNIKDSFGNLPLI